jgi:hypothetical protein
MVKPRKKNGKKRKKKMLEQMGRKEIGRPIRTTKMWTATMKKIFKIRENTKMVGGIPH